MNVKPRQSNNESEYVEKNLDLCVQLLDFLTDGGALIDADQLAKLDRLQKELHAGSDRERDFGHRLWLVVCELRDA